MEVKHSPYNLVFLCSFLGVEIPKLTVVYKVQNGIDITNVCSYNNLIAT